MKEIKVMDMSCHHCTKRIAEALAQANIEHTISLEDKHVMVADSSALEATKIIEELGYHCQ